MRTSNNVEEEYAKIKAISTPEFAHYLDVFWYPKKDKWTFSFRAEIPMFRFSNTNILIESFHNLLKTKVFKRKVNRRLDKLVYVLLATSKSHFIRREKTNLYQSKEKSPSICMFEAQSMKAKEILAESIV